MKATKFIVLVGGMLGILAFFLPLVTVTQHGVSASVSAYDVIKGVDVASSEVSRAEVTASVGSGAQTEMEDGLAAIKTFVMAVFVPAGLLALIGAVGVKRKKFGRVAGTFSLLLGVVTLGIAALLKGAAEGDGGIGLTLLLVGGLAGTVGGLLALIKPERRTEQAAQIAPAALAA